MSAILKFGAKVVAAIVIVGVVLVAVVAYVVPGLPGLPNPFATDDIDRSQPALLVSIQDISEYHAAVGNFEVVIDDEKDVPYLPSFLAGERSLFVAAGTVDAYVDLSSLADGDLEVSEDGKRVTVRLPEAELAEPNLDQDRTYLFSQDRGYLTRYGDALSTPDQSELYQKAEEKLSAAADESDLRAQATSNTQDMLTGLFGSLDMTVTFASPNDE